MAVLSSFDGLSGFELVGLGWLGYSLMRKLRKLERIGSFFGSIIGIIEKVEDSSEDFGLWKWPHSQDFKGFGEPPKGLWIRVPLISWMYLCSQMEFHPSRGLRRLSSSVQVLFLSSRVGSKLVQVELPKMVGCLGYYGFHSYFAKLMVERAR